MYGSSGAAAAIAAKKKREKQQKEEEVMTQYRSDDLDGWEFKIVRSTTGSFKNLQKVQELCAEETKSGWEMIEKFDNNRIRFKRKTSMRSNDSLAEIDPYRTTFGLGEGGLVAIILGSIFLIGGIILLFIKFNAV